MRVKIILSDLEWACQNEKQELRSSFEVNAKFPSTTPIANMINSVGTLSQSNLKGNLSNPILYSSSECTSRVNITFSFHDPLSTK